MDNGFANQKRYDIYIWSMRKILFFMLFAMSAFAVVYVMQDDDSLIVDHVDEVEVDEEEVVEPVVIPLDFIEQEVPFTSQAPTANWDDPRQQDGCEEASILMAAHWVQGTTLTAEEALVAILDLSAAAEERFGYFSDSDVDETAELMNSFFETKAAIAVHDSTLDQIIEELWKGNIVLVPADGQALNNPNFTEPGPERHMLLIKGYDAVTSEFITNDPGTKNGEGYRYNEDVLYDAIRDYPSKKQTWRKKKDQKR